MAISLPKIQASLQNPVVVRDLRIFLRGSRAGWGQGFYLGLLILISLAVYMGTTRIGNADPVSIQSNLQSFYVTVFEILAALITLVAPALTAASIITEKQRLTLDLLVTTPMSSMQMLAGKLISSIAYLLLLLAMSIPISSLCVILGGATIGDVLRIYLLLAIDGFVLAAIGLVFSCTTKHSVQAIVGSYAAVAALYFVTIGFSMSVMPRIFSSGFSIGGAGAVAPPLAALAVFCPFMSVLAPGVGVSIAGLTVPIWLAAGVAAFLFVRLLLTAAALRLGLYGAGLIASLRRQILLASLLAAFMLAQTLGPEMYTARMIWELPLELTLIFAFSCFFLPTLFVPVRDEDSPSAPPITGIYSIRSAFSGAHSGSLPYFHIWLVTTLIGLVMGTWIGLSSGSRVLPGMFAVPTATMSVRDILSGSCAALFYVSGLGFLVWSIARRMFSVSASYVTARPITFLVFVFIIGLPVMAMIMRTQLLYPDGNTSWVDGNLKLAWLLYPFTAVDYSGRAEHILPFYGSGLLAYALGALIYPFWRSVSPGKVAPAISEAGAITDAPVDGKALV